MSSSEDRKGELLLKSRQEVVERLVSLYSPEHIIEMGAALAERNIGLHNTAQTSESKILREGLKTESPQNIVVWGKHDGQFTRLIEQAQGVRSQSLRRRFLSTDEEKQASLARDIVDHLYVGLARTMDFPAVGPDERRLLILDLQDRKPNPVTPYIDPSLRIFTQGRFVGPVKTNLVCRVSNKISTSRETQVFGFLNLLFQSQPNLINTAILGANRAAH